MHYIIDNIIIPKRKLPKLPQNPNLKDYARKNRKARNLAEVVFWTHVHKKMFFGIDFNRQFIIGNYIADFYARSLGVVVEIDGASHNDKVDYDQQRDDFMKGLNLFVFRATDYDVLHNLQWVLDELKRFIIANCAATDHTAPSTSP